ncbi:MAG: hypothetical protein EAS52_11550 [Parapedobacter sp.]|nr:MAG: hypothetical protein EAS52_11550 [Parapedobacter sp.]
MNFFQVTSCLTVTCLLLVGVDPADAGGTSYPTENDNLRYSWFVGERTVYRKPDVGEDQVGHLAYGETVIVGEAVKEKPVDDDDYLWNSKWVLVEYRGDKGFMLDAFLSRYPAPDRTELPMLMDEYIGSLSPLVLEKNEGKNDEYCAKRTRHFENGITYMSTDFGPCESCGHIREEIFFPSAAKEEALMMAVYFEYQYESMPPELRSLADNADGTQWVIAYEYGQEIDIQLMEQEEGVLLIKDIFL